jgi:hypothetical protein
MKDCRGPGNGQVRTPSFDDRATRALSPAVATCYKTRDCDAPFLRRSVKAGAADKRQLLEPGP